MTRIATTRRGLLVAAGLGLAAPALAQGYPSGPVRIVVPFGPGGGVDIIARTIADEWMRMSARANDVDVLGEPTVAGGDDIQRVRQP